MKCTTAKVQTFDIQKKNNATAQRAFLLRGSVAIRSLLLQWSDWHLCNSDPEKGEGKLCKVSDQYVTPDSVLQGWMVRLSSMPNDHMLNVTFNRRSPKC